MTAFLEKGMREAALAWGATALLEKPFSREELNAALALAWRARTRARVNGAPIRQRAATVTAERTAWK
jgi:CheY-like chemotaxis protein